MKVQEVVRFIRQYKGIAQTRARVVRAFMAMYRGTPFSAVRQELEEGDPYIEDGSFFSFIETSSAAVVPPTPKINVNPMVNDENLKIVCQFRQALLNAGFRQRSFRRGLKRCYKLADILGEGFFRAYWDVDEDMPDVEILTSQEVWYDPTAKRWDKIRWLCHVQPITKKEFKAKVLTPEDLSILIQWQESGGDIFEQPDTGERLYDPLAAEEIQGGAYPTWARDIRRTGYDQAYFNTGGEEDQWVTLYHFYDYTTETYWIFADECEKPLYKGELPYLFVRNAFVRLTPTLDPETGGGLSQGQIVRNKLEERQNLMTLALQHVYKSIPQTYWNPDAFVDPDEAAEILAEANDPSTAKKIDLAPGRSWDEAVFTATQPSLNPDTGQIVSIIEQEVQKIQGLPEFAQGMASGGDSTATEMSLINQALQTRQGDKIEEIGDSLENLAEVQMLLWEQFLTPDSDIPLKLGNDKEFVVANRIMLGLRDPFSVAWAIENGKTAPAPAALEYQIEPYQPASNSKSAQLTRTIQLMTSLQSLGWVDWLNESEAVRYMVELSEIDGNRVVNSDQQMLEKRQQRLQMEQQEAQMNNAASSANRSPQAPTQSYTDTVAGGGLPEGVVPQVSTAADGEMVGGEGFPAPMPSSGQSIPG